ncbi:MAG: isoamylase early set domain-containing protein [Spirochaetaceae bacterium]|nr:isoamylase early set domain-containing protein [Spirochaetaceae bacterium]MCF7950837.1 isoamylase early set domain-containing protein [Spirochaetaceae bacterium]
MECKECREKLFIYAGEALQNEDSKKLPMVGEAELSQELREHLSECSSCAALYQALSLSSTERALHSEVPDEVSEKVLRNVMGRISGESHVIEGSFGGKAWKNKNYKRNQERAEKPRSIAALAAAAVLLVALSVTFTLAVTERRLPRGVETVVQAPSEEQAPSQATPQEQVSADTQDMQNSQEVITVHLTLEAPEAQSVAVVGDWNGWNPEKNRMSDSNKDGIWELRLKLEKGGEYQYQFLINGNRWIPDPDAPLKVEDGFGGTNSVLNI